MKSTRTMSPVDMDELDTLSFDGGKTVRLTLAEVMFPDIKKIRILWGYAEGFSRYLTSRREQHNLSVRRAAELLGISHTYLGQLEGGRASSAPDWELLDAIARVYEVDVREVRHEAGFRYEVPEKFAEKQRNLDERRLRNLFEHFRPAGYVPRDLEFIGPRLRRQILDMVAAIAAADDLDLGSILEGSVEMDNDDEEDPS